MKKNSAGEGSQIVEFDDGRSHDTYTANQITQQWIDFHMKSRESEFTTAKELYLFCGSWNVNAKKQEGGLHDWLLPRNQPLADVYAIGFQEIVDLNAMNVALNSGNTLQRAQFWQEEIESSLGSTGARYALISAKPLVGLLLCVYAKESVYSHIKDVRSTTLGVGIMGMLGNKGGVSIRFSLYDSSVCFVCAHLAAHRENVSGRNSDFKNIYERSFFPSEKIEINHISEKYQETVVLPRSGAARFVNSDLYIQDHEIIFWLGDLNYRIDDDIPIKQIFAKIEENDFEMLRQKDQLNIERAKGNVFQGFEEGQLNFPPTYKYQPGTDVYETRAEKKLRAPAWCDRVLWKTSSKEAVRLQQYIRSSLNPSDHKPISAQFNCDVREVVEKRENIVFQQLKEILESCNKQSVPTVTITGLQIDFGKVYFEQSQSTSVEIRNVGDALVLWRFVEKLEESTFSKHWLSMDKTSGLLLPNEVCQIKITIKVDRRAAHLLNAGRDALHDVINLRIEKSIDYHVTVNASYVRSCYGMSLEELVYSLDPVSTYPLLLSGSVNNNTGAGVGTGNSPLTVTTNKPKLSVPKELWRLIDALVVSDAIKEKDLFGGRPDLEEVKQIRNSLDQGLEFPSCSPHSIVEALITFIGSPAKPLLPVECYPNAEVEGQSMRGFCRKLLEDLPPLNYNVFVYILSFLREVLASSSFNRCSPEMLASVCVNCMTFPQSDVDQKMVSKEERLKRASKQEYLLKMIVYLLTTSTV
eukprot:gene11261-15109_t